jgi:hypothetical protein
MTALWHGTGCYVPNSVAVCPECGGELAARSMQWDEETGQPDAAAIEIDCIDYLSHYHGHNWHQSSWQPVRDAIAKWCKSMRAFRNPEDDMGDVICRGSRVLGSACGHCRKCYRELQDAWLALPSVANQVRNHGWDQCIAGKGSPTLADVRTFVLPKWQAWFEEFFEEERRRGNL